MYQHKSFIYNYSLWVEPSIWIILAQNDDVFLKWANGRYRIQMHANFQILMGPLQNFNGPKNPYIHIKA